MELDAARARIAALEAELAEAKEARAALETELAAATRSLARRSPDSTTPAPPPKPAPPRRWGKIHYHPPPTYWPVWHLFLAGVRAARGRAPLLSPLRSDSVLAWLGHHLVARPFIYGLLWPSYLLAMCVVVPWAGLVTCALGVLALPLVAAARLSFAERPPGGEPGLLEGHATKEQGAIFLWMVTTLSMPPLLVLCLPLLTPKGDELGDAETSGD